MSTLTASQFNSNVVAHHLGNITVGGVVDSTATATASSVWLLCRVPNGAVILDWMIYVDDAGADTIWKIGTSNTESALGSFSLSASQSNLEGSNYRDGRLFSHLLPVQVSLSDDVEPSHVWIQAVNSAAVSASADIRFQLTYTMNGMTTDLKIR